jgi:hypothetical protein
LVAVCRLTFITPVRKEARGVKILREFSAGEFLHPEDSHVYPYMPTPLVPPKGGRMFRLLRVAAPLFVVPRSRPVSRRSPPLFRALAFRVSQTPTQDPRSLHIYPALCPQDRRLIRMPPGRSGWFSRRARVSRSRCSIR